MTEQEIVKYIKSGEIIAIPTDTIYGLVGLPKKDIVQKIYAIKKRGKDKPLGLFVNHKDILKNFVSVDFKNIEDAVSFWPGALTLIIPVKDEIYPFIQKNGKIGFRIPDYPLLLNIMKKTGPLVQTSANISGKKSLQTAEEVKKIFKDKVKVVEGKTGNLSSTVLDFKDGYWHVLRKGSIPIVKLGEKIKVKTDEFNLIFLCTGNTERSPMAMSIAKGIFKGLPVNIESRGMLGGGMPYSEIAQKVVEKLGYKSIEDFSKEINYEDLLWADLVLVMEKRHSEFLKENFPEFKDKVYMLSWDDIPDPVGFGEKTHELVARMIETEIKNRWFKFIKSFI